MKLKLLPAALVFVASCTGSLAGETNTVTYSRKELAEKARSYLEKRYPGVQFALVDACTSSNAVEWIQFTDRTTAVNCRGREDSTMVALFALKDSYTVRILLDGTLVAIDEFHLSDEEMNATLRSWSPGPPISLPKIYGGYWN